jgi:NAD(P)-dependent dehydrogenase (short-subunit alcohol dehydrogenase family)
MKIDLTEKTAIVTGSRRHRLCDCQGIGARGCRRCATAASRRPSVDEAISKIKGTTSNAPVRGVAADLGTAQGCAAVVQAEPSTDILVNNVGIFGPQDFFETPDEEWEHFLAINVMSGVRLSRAYLPRMKARNWGRVIFVSSEFALNIPADMINYGVTKTACRARRAASPSAWLAAVSP